MDEHAKELVEAVGKLLDAIEAHERSNESDPLKRVTDKIRVYRLDEFESYFERGQHLVDDPIGQSYRAGIRSIGKVLAKTVGVSGMQEALDHLIRVRGDQGSRVDIVDKNWDGITGKDGDEWIA